MPTTMTLEIPSLETTRRRCVLTALFVLGTSGAFASSPPPAQTSASPVTVNGESGVPAPELSSREVRAFKTRAQEATRQKDFAGCASLYEEAGDAYSAACCHALGGNRDAAFLQLGLAIDRKFRDVSLLDRDTDLVTLREDPRWAAERARLVAKVEAGDGINTELQRIYEEDQADRRVGPDGTIDWARVGLRDTQRRKRVDEILAAGGLKFSGDYFNAAMIYQHGESVAEIQRAHELALEAAKLDPANDFARWLAAAAEDRALMYENKPQKWGTQLKLVEGAWVVWPVDPAITDEQRAEWNVPPLAVAQARAVSMNSNQTKP